MVCMPPWLIAAIGWFKPGSSPTLVGIGAPAPAPALALAHLLFRLGVRLPACVAGRRRLGGLPKRWARPEPGKSGRATHAEETLLTYKWLLPATATYHSTISGCAPQ